LHEIEEEAMVLDSFFPTFNLCFLVKAWKGRGDNDAIRESTGRDFAFTSETKQVSAKGGGRPAAPPPPMKRPLPRGFGKRGVVPAPPAGVVKYGIPLASAPAFSPSQQGDGFERPMKLEMIRKKFLAAHGGVE